MSISSAIGLITRCPVSYNTLLSDPSLSHHLANFKKSLRKFCKVVGFFFYKTNFKQERHCTNNVALRRVRITIIVVEKLGI